MLAQLIPSLRTIFLTPPPFTSPQDLSNQQQQPQQLSQQSNGASKPGFAGFEPQRRMLGLEFDKLANVSVCASLCVCVYQADAFCCEERLG